MSMIIKSHRELDVYNNAMNAAVAVQFLAKHFPSDERYRAVDQILRCSRSVCANIAESWRKRRYTAHFVSKLTDAQAEATFSRSRAPKVALAPSPIGPAPKRPCCEA